MEPFEHRGRYYYEAKGEIPFYETLFKIGDVIRHRGVIYLVWDIQAETVVKLSVRDGFDPGREANTSDQEYVLVVQQEVDTRFEHRPGIFHRIYTAEVDGEVTIYNPGGSYTPPAAVLMKDWDEPLVEPDNDDNRQARKEEWQAAREEWLEEQERLEQERLEREERIQEEEAARLAHEESRQRASESSLMRLGALLDETTQESAS